MYRVNKKRVALFLICIILIITAIVFGIRQICVLAFSNNNAQQKQKINTSQILKENIAVKLAMDKQDAENKAKEKVINDAKLIKAQQYKEYYVDVSIKDQKVTVYYNGKIIKTMICSTGLDVSPTPKGEYKTDGKGESFFSDEFGEGAYYWLRFLGAYLFHSVPFDNNEKIIPEEAQKLGEKASHGCIRLSIEDSKWLYNNIPEWNTPVTVD